MAEASPEILPEMLKDVAPDISHIVTEDDTPVDNLFSEKQQRLLAGSLNCCWNPGRPFVAAANVGVFYSLHEPPIVPDMFLSMDVTLPDDLWKKRNRSYFSWEYGKPPDVAVEVVSNRVGAEIAEKIPKYENARVSYYIIFDPLRQIQKVPLRLYKLSAGKYLPKPDRRLRQVGLGLTLWEGVFEGRRDIWLRWLDSEGKLIGTGEEMMAMEQQRAESAERLAEEERQRAESAERLAGKERRRADKLAEKLKAMGITDINGSE